MNAMMELPATRTSFKRSASDDEDEASQSTSKRAKTSSGSRTPASRSPGSPNGTSTAEPPKRFTPDGREIPYVKPRPNGSWRMITGEQIAYSPEELPTVAPASAYKQAVMQSFGQSTHSGKKRGNPPTSEKPTASSSKISQSVCATPSASTSSGPLTNSKEKQPTSTRPTPGSSKQAQQLNDSSSPSTHLNLIESIGDIFSALPNTLVIHACNTEGSWGAGIAKAFRTTYPSAFEIYKSHCHLNGGQLVGTALLITPPHFSSSASSSSSPSSSSTEPQHFIGCLFTSLSKGARKSSPEKILRATAPAMKDLIKQVRGWNRAHGHGHGKSVGTAQRVGEVRMCKINSGLFNVKWEKTKQVLETISVEDEGGDDADNDDDEDDEQRDDAGFSFREIRVISRSEED